MLKLDNDLLQQLGLGSLPDDQKRSMLQHIYDTLELRVGTNLANQMTDQQLLEFERFMDAGGDSDKVQALKWLETNLPHYKEVVSQEFEKLKAEVMQMAPQILAASTPAPVMSATDDGGYVTTATPSAPVAPMSGAANPVQSLQPQSMPGYASPQPAYTPQSPYSPSGYGQPQAVPTSGYYGSTQDPASSQQQTQPAWPQQGMPVPSQPVTMPVSDGFAQFPQQQPPAGPPSGYPPQTGYSA